MSDARTLLRLFTNNFLNLLLLAIPFGWVAHFVHWPPVAVFVLVRCCWRRRCCRSLAAVWLRLPFYAVCIACACICLAVQRYVQALVSVPAVRRLLFKLKGPCACHRPLAASAPAGLLKDDARASLTCGCPRQNLVGLVPLALVLGELTEDLAIRFGEVVGGLLVRAAAAPACPWPRTLSASICALLCMCAIVCCLQRAALAASIQVLQLMLGCAAPACVCASPALASHPSFLGVQGLPRPDDQ